MFGEGLIRSMVPIPEVLNHYTSQAGLIGIIGGRCVWASSIYYLNDAREFVYARDVFRQVADNLLKKADPEIATIWRSKLEPYLTDRPQDRLHPFVFSLSAQGDLLSQWRGYTPVTGGYCIGFRTDVLASVLPKGFVLASCIYSEKTQRAMVKRLLVDTKPRGQKDLFHVGWVRFSMALHHEFATVFKHPAFFQEEEWRCVSPWFGGKHGWSDDLKAPLLEVRVGNSMLTPYVKIKIPEDAMPSLISRVRVGPTPHVQLAARVVEKFLQEHGISAEVVASKIPFRAW